MQNQMRQPLLELQDGLEQPSQEPLSWPVHQSVSSMRMEDLPHATPSDESPSSPGWDPARSSRRLSRTWVGRTLDRFVGLAEWWEAGKKGSLSLRRTLAVAAVLVPIIKLVWALYLSYVVASYYSEIRSLKDQIEGLNEQIASAQVKVKQAVLDSRSADVMAKNASGIATSLGGRISELTEFLANVSSQATLAATEADFAKLVSANASEAVLSSQQLVAGVKTQIDAVQQNFSSFREELEDAAKEASAISAQSALLQTTVTNLGSMLQVFEQRISNDTAVLKKTLDSLNVSVDTGSFLARVVDDGGSAPRLYLYPARAELPSDWRDPMVAYWTAYNYSCPQNPSCSTTRRPLGDFFPPGSRVMLGFAAGYHGYNMLAIDLDWRGLVCGGDNAFGHGSALSLLRGDGRVLCKKALIMTGPYTHDPFGTKDGRMVGTCNSTWGIWVSLSSTPNCFNILQTSVQWLSLDNSEIHLSVSMLDNFDEP